MRGQRPLAAEGTHRVTVSLSIHNDYDDSDDSIDKVKEFLSLGLFERLNANSATDDAVFRRYWFGPSKLPKTFALIQAAILAANPKRSVGESMLVPALPRLSAQPDKGNPYRELPRVASYRAVGTFASGLILVQVGDTDEKDRRSARIILLQIDMDAATFEVLLTRMSEKAKVDLLRSISESVPGSPPDDKSDSQRKSSTLHNRPSTTTNSTGKAPDLVGASTFMTFSSIVGAESLQTAEARERRADAEERVKPPKLSKQRPSFLLVMDEGWPDVSSAQESIQLVQRFINAGRARHGLREISIPVPASVPLTHTSEIASAIDPYVKADSTHVVKVYYLPVRLVDNTRGMLRAILADYELELRLDPNAYDTANHAFDDEANARATRDLDDWDSDLRHDSLGAASWRIHSAVMTFLYSLGDYLTGSSTAFIANESWTISQRLFSVPHSQWDVTVCAVGNDFSDLSKVPLDFAQRAANDNEFLAVIAADSAGNLQCSSNWWAESALKDKHVVAYDGVIPGDCGTSFAAPRVAWWLAAAVGSRPAPFPEDWRQSLVSLVCGPESSRSSWRAVYFNPTVIEGWH